MRVRSVFNATRWGSRKLTLLELAHLWDVPLLLQEHCATSRSLIVLSELLVSTPGKVLQLGTDALLASYFRGGFRPAQSIDTSMPSVFRLSDTTSAGPTPPPTIILPPELDFEVLKQEGQKSDNAEVPVRLWDTMYFLSLSPEQRLRLPSNWRKLLALLRLHAIRGWRYRVANSLIKAIKKKMDPNITYQPRRWVDGHMIIPGRRHGSDWVYRWTSSGRDQYRKAWLQVRGNGETSGYWEPGRE